MWKEDFEDVDHIVHGRPGLVDDVETDRTGELVDVWVEYSVDEADAGRLVGVLVGDFDVNLPVAAGERGLVGAC